MFPVPDRHEQAYLDIRCTECKAFAYFHFDGEHGISGYICGSCIRLMDWRRTDRPKYSYAECLEVFNDKCAERIRD